ncbi:MAG: HAD family hydrolase [Candidatus Levyibacteriota bacterium]
MIDLAIPGFGRLALTDLVCDFNGTLARDGRLLAPSRELLPRVAASLQIHVVTADTCASAQAELQGLPCALTVLGPEGQARAKAALVERIGAGGVVAVGNGRNDAGMLGVAALGIGVIGDEGIAAEAMLASRIVCRSIADALALLLNPRRLVATLRD